jgi:nitrogen fixation NifU-like protein
MDHYRYPRGRKKLDGPDIINEGKNPVCGDEIELSLKISDDRVEDIAVECAGCAISVASGSLLADAVKGKSLQEVKNIASAVKAIIKGELIPANAGIGELEALAGVKNFPVRIKCALLSWTTLIDGIEAHEVGKTIKITTTE